MADATDELEREADAHRANIAHLVNELRAHVTPGEIVNQLLGEERGADIAKFVARQFRAHPIPVGVIGAGVAWLLLADALERRRRIPLHDGLDYQDFDESSGRSSRLLDSAGRVARGLSQAAALAGRTALHSHQEARKMTAKQESNGSGARQLKERNAGTGDDMEDDPGRKTEGFVSRTLQKGRETAGHLAGRTQDVATGLARTALDKSGEAISGAAEAVGETASSLMERTTTMARRTGRAASNTAGRTGTSVSQFAREQPLLVAGIGFALGVALGALLPLTRAEGELLGEQADRLKDKASDLVSEGYDKVKSVAQDTYRAAVETAQDQTDKLTGKTSGTEQGTGTGQTYGTEDAGTTGSTSYHH
jgi:ElaB/YqjD/DUF883 family membrane-anchored ribosome-binding protein